MCEPVGRQESAAVDKVDAVDGVDWVDAAGEVRQEIVSLWEVIEGLRQEIQSQRQELVDLRMDRRKVMLEELARLEEPLVERGVIAQRTRPPRHGRMQGDQ